MLPDCPKTLENRMTLPTDAMHTKEILSKFIGTSPCSSGEDHPNLIIPGIYSTNCLDAWTPEKLRSYGFTHIINIDEHIRNIDLNLEKLRIPLTAMTVTTRIEETTNPIKSSSISSCTYNNNNNKNTNISNTSSSNNNHNNISNNIDIISNENSILDRVYKNSTGKHHQLIEDNEETSFKDGSSEFLSGGGGEGVFKLYSHLEIIRAEFEILDLNFGEESYLMTVLPNCYKAVKFIEKALQNGGFILIADSNSNQKCLTIVTAYLMYKNNINFNEAFQRIKGIFKKAELEKFFISQLYEYEPILQVQKALARGHSCSRELRSALLKRKKIYDDTIPSGGNSRQNGGSEYHFNNYTVNSSNFHYHHDISGDVLME